MEEKQAAIVHETFGDILAHKQASDIIRRYSSNLNDIRRVALTSVNLSRCRTVMDLGCGYGFFTEALKDGLPLDASVLGLDALTENELPYLESCKKAGLRGNFRADGLCALSNLPPASFDLILCSYALYFFPDAIRCIADLLKDDGCFVAITHSRNTMIELIEMVKCLLKEKGLLNQSQLPIEMIIGLFCAENGESLLIPAFESVLRIDYFNTLTFPPEDIASLGAYFRFKGAFFLSQTTLNKDEIASMLLEHLKKRTIANQGFSVVKDDAIFICTKPRRKDPA